MVDTLRVLMSSSAISRKLFKKNPAEWVNGCKKIFALACWLPRHLAPSSYCYYHRANSAGATESR